MSEISKQALLVDNSQSFPNNNAGAITPSDLRAFNVNMIDSLVDEITYNVDSASWNVQIGQLNAFTASQQPSFTALNSFTASQLVTNANLNLFTQSANQELDSLSAWTGSWEAWTSSINEIRDDGVLQGYSTRFFFNGLVSASIVQNVSGPIANVTIQQDGTKLNTASFNEYTASTAATQSVFSASVATSISQSSNAFNTFSASQNSFNLSATASLVELLNLSSSLSGGYATQGELDQSASVLQANIDTKLNTSSFNDYTSSNDAKVNSLISFTGSYATTGSNSFNGNQIITGSVTISGSATSDLTVVGQIYVSSSATTGTTQPRIIVSGSQGQTTITRNSIITRNLTNQATLNPSFISANIVATGDEIGFSVDPVTGGISGWSTGPAIYVNNDALDTYPAVFGFQDKADYTDGRVAVLTPLSASAGIIDARITGSTIVTGSVCGNVVGLSIASQTASMDLIVGNFFTLTLVSGSTTHLTATNIRPGQTVNLLLTQPSDGTGSVSYNSTFDFPAGNSYTATPITSSKDIISLITFDSSIIYATSINNLV
jgi:hypothetical protein